MTTQLHLSSEPKKVTTCFVLNDCSDDCETLADIAGQKRTSPNGVNWTDVFDTDSFYR